MCIFIQWKCFISNGSEESSINLHLIFWQRCYISFCLFSKIFTKQNFNWFQNCKVLFCLVLRKSEFHCSFPDLSYMYVLFFAIFCSITIVLMERPLFLWKWFLSLTWEYLFFHWQIFHFTVFLLTTKMSVFSDLVMFKITFFQFS